MSIFNKLLTSGECILWTTDDDEIASAAAAGWTNLGTAGYLYVYKGGEPYPPSTSRGVMRLLCPNARAAWETYLSSEYDKALGYEVKREYNKFAWKLLESGDVRETLLTPNYHRFYTTNVALAKVLVKYGWVYEGCIGFVDDSAVADSHDDHITKTQIGGGGGLPTWTKTTDFATPARTHLWASQYLNGSAQKYDATVIPYLTPASDCNFVPNDSIAAPVKGATGWPFRMVGSVPAEPGPGVRPLRGFAIRNWHNAPAPYEYDGNDFWKFGPRRTGESDPWYGAKITGGIILHPIFIGIAIYDAATTDTSSGWVEWDDRDKVVDKIGDENPWL